MLFWKITAVAVVAFGAAVAVRVVCAIALRKALLDLPNERSSHKVPVPRLGGAAFLPVVLGGVALMWSGSSLPLSVRAPFFVGALVLFGISLLDDVSSLPARIRFAAHFAAVTGVVYSAVATGLPAFSSLDGMAVVLPVTIAVVGLLNIYNFMDGIDGIAGLQAVVGGAGWYFIASEMSAPSAASLAGAIAAGALGFLTLNWPPAKIFMGDAGSTVIGYSFGIIPLLVWVEAAPAVLEPLLIAGALVVWPFLADGTFTILRRLRKRENIFKAHRSHLYQRLVIAGKSHRNVTLAYGLLAAIGGTLAWCVIQPLPYAIPASGIVVGALFFALWRWTIACERRTGAH
jgi:Fuc2NAc and GlcNAc transferase